MVAVRIEDNVEPMLKAVAGDLSKLLEASATVGRAANVLVDAIKAEVRARFRDRSGALEDSWHVEFLAGAGGVNTAAAVSDLPYAQIQNDGGTILPRVRKNLAIPLSGAGVPRGKSPRDFPTDALTFMKSKRGTKLLGLVRKGQPPKPLFVLKSRVTIPGTGYIDAAVSGSFDDVVDTVARQVEVLIERRSR